MQEAERQRASHYRQQQNLFEQARHESAAGQTNINTDQQPFGTFPDHYVDRDRRRDRDRQMLQELLIDQMLQQGRNPQEEPDLQRQVTDLFLEVDVDTARDFFQQIEDDRTSSATSGAQAGQQREQQLSVLRQLVQRLRLCLHPDKNRDHPRAGDAFVRL